MQTQRYDDLVINRWRLEPRLRGLELGDPDEQEQAPPLWKDLTLASIIALVLWMAAAAVFG
ncbi:MAG TPA: hypothetical protein VF147_05905 [Vicinamibacterales bacterium]